MSTAGLEATLDARVAALEAARGGTIRVAELGEVVGDLMRGIEGDLNGAAIQLHAELSALVDYIRRAKHEIAAISTDDIAGEKIPLATDELDAVVRATEEATGTILDTAESLMGIAAEIGGDLGERLTDHATRIFEASNFQDITGQRIAKVVGTLRYIESRVSEIAAATGAPASGSRTAGKPADRDQAPSDEDLLNGPQLPQNANSQDDIDALFASL
jgi:chemotaxis protein CheZ